jgi:pimeloyl-ACP methyl ester carboxylesterase
MISLHSLDFTVMRSDNSTLTLRATAYLPDGVTINSRSPLPTAVLFHGFGGTRIEYGRYFVQIGRMLAQAGFAAIAYDRAGHGESDGDFFDTSTHADVKDAVQVIRQIRKLPFVDPHNLHFVGLSMGSIVASLTAPQLDEQPRSMVLTSAATSFVDEITKEHKIQGQSLEGLKQHGYFDFMGQAMGPAEVEDAAHLDPYEEARGFNGDVLFIHGTADFIPLDYIRRYSNVYGKHMTLKIIQGGGHGFGNVEHRKIVLPSIRDFLLAHAR